MFIRLGVLIVFCLSIPVVLFLQLKDDRRNLRFSVGEIAAFSLATFVAMVPLSILKIEFQLVSAVVCGVLGAATGILWLRSLSRKENPSVVFAAFCSGLFAFGYFTFGALVMFAR